MEDLKELKQFAEDRGLDVELRGFYEAGLGSKWTARLCSRHLHQPLGTGIGSTMEDAVLSLCEKAERCYEGHKSTLERNKVRDKERDKREWNNIKRGY